MASVMEVSEKDPAGGLKDFVSSATDEQSSRTANSNHCVYLHCRCELHPAATVHDAVEISGPMVSQPHAVERIPPIKLAVRSPRQFAH